MRTVRLGSWVTIVFFVLFSPVAIAAELPAKNVLLDQVIEVLDGEHLIHGVLEAFVTMAGSSIDEERLQGLSEEERLERVERQKTMAERQKIFMEKLVRHLDTRKITDELLRPLFDENYSAKELAALLEFLNSSSGAKTISILPDLTNLSTRLIYKQSEEFREAGRKAEMEMAKEGIGTGAPEKRTMADMRSIATATEAYGVDNDTYPEADSIESLATFISPTYIKHVPHEDGWGNEYRYVVSDDLRHYRIASSGPDGVFAWDSVIRLDQSQVDRPDRPSSGFNDDILYQDGRFILFPEDVMRN